MSVKRGRKSHDYTSMKSIGIKVVDETFKVIMTVTMLDARAALYKQDQVINHYMHQHLNYYKHLKNKILLSLFNLSCMLIQFAVKH